MRLSSAGDVRGRHYPSHLARSEKEELACPVGNARTAFRPVYSAFRPFVLSLGMVPEEATDQQFRVRKVA